jgi:hypothetical protein
VSRRNRPAAPTRPAAGPALDDRSTDEVLAAVRRKLLFGLLALCAPLIALAVSLAVDRSRRAAVEAHLPEGVTLATPLAGPPSAAANVGERLAELGAELRDGAIVDASGKPVVFRPPDAPPPEDPDAVSVVAIREAGAR